MLSIRLKDNSIVDVFWGFGFIVISWYLFFYYQYFNIGNILFLALINLWGLRLSGSIFLKKIQTKKEDARYAKWRGEWKNFYLRSFFQVYILQMFLLFIVSIPLFVVFENILEIDSVFLAGFLVSIFGFIYETLADYQLSSAIKNKTFKSYEIFTGGLFKYSRHPNYFGEIFFWFGVFIISLNFSFLGFFGFFMITFLLLFVSGVPMKEERYKLKSNWGEYSKVSKILPKWW
ncbi:MAG: DUF1295 domain-containing protein [Candidatus Altimarinota bacterium]